MKLTLMPSTQLSQSVLAFRVFHRPRGEALLLLLTDCSRFGRSCLCLVLLNLKIMAEETQPEDNQQ